MTRRILVLILLSAFSFQLSAMFAEAAPVVALEELLENAQEYDGKAVVYKGEVIGDIMVRSFGSAEDKEDYAWLNVRAEDGTLAIGVFCPQELVSKIEHQGSYWFTGDIISVRGIFHSSCSQHGGDTDIHAEKITIIQKGQVRAHPVEPQKLKLSIILPAITLALAIVLLIVRRFR